MLTAVPTAVDINPDGESSPSDYVVVGDLTYFVADDGTHGRELWATDGTKAGTSLVADIQTGSESSNPRSLMEFDGELYFIADDGVHGDELWKSDGTAAGTMLVIDVDAADTSSFSDAAELKAFDGLLYFTADDGVVGEELWRTDGTALGTELVSNIAAGADSSSPRNLTEFAGALYFSADDGTVGRELWKSDGTSSGTVLVKDAYPGTYPFYNGGTFVENRNNSLSPEKLTVAGGILFFIGNSADGLELWRTDGTASGIFQLRDVNPGEADSLVFTGESATDSPLLAVGNTLYFAADDGVHGSELWKSDGTPAGTVLVKDINPGADGDLPYFGGFTDNDGVLFFSADDGTHGRELWKSDGTETGTVLVKDINPGEGASAPNNSFPFYMASIDGTLYFSAFNGDTGRELWKSDGTEAGTVLVADAVAGGEGLYPNSITAAGGTVAMTGSDDQDRELFLLLEPEPVTTITANLSIYVDGEQVAIPADIGVHSGGENSIVFTESAGGEIQALIGETITLDDFFNVWRTDAGEAGNNADAFFSSTQLMDAVADGTSNVQMFVNGQVSEKFEDYVVQDGDHIVLAFGDAPIVSLNTNFGSLVIELFAQDAPGTVNNFLKYVNDGDYINSIFHRSVRNFVIQGGGFTTTSTSFNPASSDLSQFGNVPTDPPITNEPGRLNTRSTVAMAKTSNPDSATSQFFVNLKANTTLDNPNNSGGFTVFGQVLDMTTVDTIASLPIRDVSSNPFPFEELPVSADNQLAVIQSVAGEGRISGVKFSDDNGNGVRDSGESGIAGATIYLDANNNGAFDSGEVSTTTDSSGAYQFQVAAGTHTVRTVLSPGASLSVPSGSYTVAIQIAQTVTGRDFGETEFSGPSSVDLVAVADSGASSTDNLTKFNNTNGATLIFQVSGVTIGAEVRIYAGDVLIGTATAATTQITVTTDGTTQLADGSHEITATQVVGGEESAASPALTITIDSIPPAAITTTAPNTAQVGVAYTYNADSPDEGETGIVYSLSGAPNGMTIAPATGVVSWTPTAQQATSGSFSVRVSDAAGNLSSQLVNVTVFGDIPALPDEYTLTEDGSLTVDAAAGVLANDGNETTGTLTASVVAQPTHGTLSFNDDGSFTYTPNADFFGEDQFTYQASDGVDDSNIASVKLTVTGVNDAPTAAADSYATNEDTPLTVNVAQGVLVNDDDVDGDSLTAVVVDQPSHGTLVLAADGSFTYTPNANFFGSDSFTYRASDGAVSTDPVTVTLLVNELGDPPTANPNSYTVDEDAVLTVNAANGVLSNDTDPDSETLTAAVVALPSHGTLSLAADGSFVYTPTANYFGPDSFTYTASDGVNTSAAATVTITVAAVADAPTANDDSATATADGAAKTIDVLANDSTAPDGNQALTITALTQGSNGGTVAISSGSVTYQPASGFVGTETFTYTIEDTDGLTDTATVTMTVSEAANNTFSGFVYLDADGDGVRDSGEIGVPGVQVTITGVGGDAAGVSRTMLTSASGFYSFTGLPAGTYEIVERQPTAMWDGADSTPLTGADKSVNDKFGAMALSGGQSFTENNFGEKGLRSQYTNITWYFASSLASQADLLREAIARAEELAGFTDLANAIRGGGSQFNTQPTAVNDSYDAGVGGPLVVSAAQGVLANDVDAEGDSLTAALVASTTHGSLSLSANGSFTYTPNAGFTGTDQFTYRASDGEFSSNTATVTINVGSANSAPTATNDSYSTSKGSALVVNAGQGVLANDTDPENDALTAVLVASPSNGTLSFNANGSFTYTPNANFQGSDQFTYRASDGTLQSNTATVTITVAAANTAPTAVNDAYDLGDNNVLIVNASQGVLANDTDPENDALTAVLVASTTHGSLTFNANGSFSYTPNAGFEGTDQFTYRASDGALQSNTATVTISVSIPNRAPAATDDAYSVDEDQTLTVGVGSGVLANDTDADGDSLAASVVTEPSHGVLTLNTDGSFTYVPASNYSGSDSFTYQASDGAGGVDQASVVVTINPINDAPIAVADGYTMDEDTVLTVNAAAGVLANDSDPEGSSLTAVLVAQPEHGTVTLNPDGSFVYTPDANYAGGDMFRYAASDGSLESTPVDVAIQVEPIEDFAVIVLPEEFTDPNQAAQRTVGELIDFTVIVIDPDDDDNLFQLDLEASGIPAGAATPTIDPTSGQFLWTPTATGEFAITVIVVNGEFEANQEMFMIQITPA